MSNAPTNLRTENRQNPIGLPLGLVRLSWWSGDTRDAEVQSGYQIQAATTAEMLLTDADLWDTGKVNSGNRIAVKYEGVLPANGQVCWRVRTFDSDGLASEWSESSVFELVHPALLARAMWVTAPGSGSRSQGAPVVALRHQFEINGPVQFARLCIAALGVVQVEINGQLVSPAHMASGWSNYAQRVGMCTVDMDTYLHSGVNAIGIFLGDGWYAGALDGVSREHYGERPLVQAALEYIDGGNNTCTVCTDGDWRWQRTGVLSSDVVWGERIDARQVLQHISQPMENDSQWQPVEVVDAPGCAVVASGPIPLGEMQRYDLGPLLRRMGTSPAGLRRWRADLGTTILGQFSVTLAAGRGDYLRVAAASELGADGEPMFVSHDDYTARGDAEETFTPLFSLHAIRWLEFEGDVPSDAILEVTVQQIGARLKDVGSFESDHSVVDRFFSYCRGTLDNVLLSVPVSGVRPLERLGVPAQYLPISSSVPYLVDASVYLRSWLLELFANELPEGGLAEFVPPVRARIALDQPINVSSQRARIGLGGDALIRAAWSAYRVYGDRALIQQALPFAQRFLASVEQANPDLIRDGVKVVDATPSALVPTATLFETPRLATRMAGTLGRLAEMEALDQLAGRVRKAFRRRFVTSDGALVGDTATSYVIALALDLLEGDERTGAVVRLVEHIHAAQFHNCVDPVVVDKLFDVLVREGRVDLAYSLLLQTSEPSWLHPVLAGEQAGVDARGVSAVAFLFRHVAGICEDPSMSEEGNAFRHVLIQPRPPLGDRFPEGAPLSRVSAGYDSVHGRYQVEWQIEAQAFELKVDIPCGCQAVVVMPDSARHSVGAGSHKFVMPLTPDDDGIPLLKDTLNR